MSAACHSSPFISSSSSSSSGANGSSSDGRRHSSIFAFAPVAELAARVDAAGGEIDDRNEMDPASAAAENDFETAIFGCSDFDTRSSFSVPQCRLLGAKGRRGVEERVDGALEADAAVELEELILALEPLEARVFWAVRE